MQYGVVMKVKFHLTGSRLIGDQRNNSLHKRLWLNNKGTVITSFGSAGGELARMLIQGERQGEYTEE
jgi:hypothetical protein